MVYINLGPRPSDGKPVVLLASNIYEGKLEGVDWGAIEWLNVACVFEVARN